MMRIIQLVLFIICITHVVNGDEGTFLHVTDFHWDFTYGNKDWSCNGEVDNYGLYGDYWCDSPWKLISDTVEAMRNATSNPDFILWTGDSVLHTGNENLNLDSNDATIGNLTDLLRNHFPNTPVYATYGNHDYYPNNQFPPNNNELYNRTLQRWKEWISDLNEQDNFLKGGYYTIKTTHGIRILALNTNLYYTSDKVTANMEDPADQFNWMNVVLMEARTQNEKVLITGHVPPGISPSEDTRWMYEHFNKKIIEILLKYNDVIVGMHFGHEHADNFRVLYDQSGIPKIVLFLAPSVTPWRYKIPGSTGVAHNPGFRLVKYNRTNGNHIDMIQYYMDLTESNKRNESNWKVEYTATTDQNIYDLSPSSMDKLIRKMENRNSQEFKNYAKWNTVSANHSSNAPCDRKCHAKMYCNFANLHLSRYTACLNEYTSRACDLKIHLRSLIVLLFIKITVL